MAYDTILHITAADLDKDGYYIGSTDVSAEFDGSIEIAADLGRVVFKTSIRAKYSIRAMSHSGIEAGLDIKAGWGIEAGWGIKAGFDIKAGLDIKAGRGIEAGLDIKAGRGIEAGGRGIKAGRGIEAGLGIEAGWGIKAGFDIKAGLGIEAGRGIEAGLSIVGVWISARLRVFAGLCAWRLPDESEMEIRAELRGGIIAFGTHVPPTAASVAEPAGDAPPQATE